MPDVLGLGFEDHEGDFAVLGIYAAWRRAKETTHRRVVRYAASIPGMALRGERATTVSGPRGVRGAGATATAVGGGGERVCEELVSSVCGEW